MTVPTPLQPVLSVLSGKTMTLGWDAIAGYNVGLINDLFAQQYVANMRASQTLGPINDTVDFTSTSRVTLQNVYLGPPLISFAQDGTQQAIVQLPFLSGGVLVEATSGQNWYATAYQSIVPADPFVLQMTVTLENVTGTVTFNNQTKTSGTVAVDLQSASDYTVNLLAGTTDATFLGQYFQELLKKAAPGSLTYPLGSVIFGTSENLTPTSFEFHLQPKAGGGPTDALLLLLITTTYSTASGSTPGSTFPYLMPSGYDAFLLVRSSILFENIMKPFLLQSISGSPVIQTGLLAGTNPASSLSFTGGAADAGPISFGSRSGDTTYSIWSGRFAGFNQSGLEDCYVPYNGLTIQPQNNLLTVNWTANWSQQFTAMTSVEPSHVLPSISGTDVPFSIQNATYVVTPAVNAATDVVSFAGAGSPVVTFQQVGWVSRWFQHGNGVDQVGTKLTAAAQPVAKAVLNFQLPNVDAFAVSHLLFPANNVMQFSDAYVPGDLALFGSIAPQQTAFTVAPVQAVAGAGETVQFTAANGSSVTWSINPRIGTILQSGLYQAPSQLPVSTSIVVTATQGSEVATAIVTVVPTAVAVNPSFVLVFQNSKATTFNAVAGALGAVTWSVSPNDGSVGSISASGVYTPPATFSSILGATITATAGGQSASALVALMPFSMSINVLPQDFISLQAGGTQQFSVPAGTQGASWSVLGPGTVDNTGNYHAPTTLTQNATAFVYVTGSAFGTTFAGGAVVALSPAPS